jgi:hypothetical protein
MHKLRRDQNTAKTNTNALHFYDGDFCDDWDGGGTNS